MSTSAFVTAEGLPPNARMGCPLDPAIELHDPGALPRFGLVGLAMHLTVTFDGVVEVHMHPTVSDEAGCMVAEQVGRYLLEKAASVRAENGL